MITDHFASLTDVLHAEYAASRNTPRHGQTTRIIEDRLLRPLMPASVRYGTGIVIDIQERQAGPFDIVAASDAWPPLGQGDASIYLSDGVLFCLSARDWAGEDLTQYAQMCATVKSLTRKTTPIPCIAFSYTPIETSEVLEFMKSRAGEPLDAVFSLGKSLVVRNGAGWYGDPAHVPFVTETVAAPALKFLAFYLLQTVQNALGMPFGWADYQHL